MTPPHHPNGPAHTGSRGAPRASRIGAGARPLIRAAALVTAGAALGLPAEAFAQGCAMCGTAVTSANDPLARGLAYSIVLMLAAPNLLIATIGGWLFFVYRRAAVHGRLPDRTAGTPGSAQTRDEGPGGAPLPKGETR